MKQKLIAIGLSMLMSITPVSGSGQGQIRVVENCSISDIGITQFGPYGSATIIWNSCLAGQMGAGASAFFFQHELGHAYLRTSSEDEADCYAVRVLRNSNPGAIWAFIQLKRSQGIGGGDFTHRFGIARAQHAY